jgi:hypothetical protein
LKTNFTHLLLGARPRKLKNTRKVVDAVYDQDSFDELFTLIFHHERPLVIRAADSVEKITLEHSEYLVRHKDQILGVMKSGDHQELKWHIAPLLARLNLTTEELADVWHTLTYWTLNPNESQTVRVNALQGLFDISRRIDRLQVDFFKTLLEMEHEPFPSIQIRVRKLKRLTGVPEKKT